MSKHDRKTWDIAVLGGANWDFLVRGPSLPEPGGTVRGDDFQEAPGGKGANQAVAAARLGARTTFIGRVGRDERGLRIVRQLRHEGVDITHVRRDARSPTGIAVVQVEQRGEKQILTAPGANVRISRADVRAAGTTIAASRVLLLQLEAPLPAVAEAVRIAHRAGTIVALDPAPAIPLADSLLRQVYLIRPNADEARIITRTTVRDRRSARRAARRLLKRGVSVAVIQAGESGDLLVWRGGEIWLPRFKVKAIDATGAGDAFAAAVAVGLAFGIPLGEAGRFASAAAALATTRLGAQAALPTRRAVEAFLRRGPLAR
jgi:ribokinase